MTTITHNGYSRPNGRTSIQKTRRQPQPLQQPKKSILRAPARGSIANKSKDIKIRFGHYPYTNTMYHNPAAYLKRRRFDELDIDPFTDPLYDWDQPSDLDGFPLRTMSSPVRTPPRLRSLMTSPGLKLYRNPHNLRRAYSPLPGIDWQAPVVNLDGWGLSPADYRLTNIFARSQPSPLSRFDLNRRANRQKKPYIVVPKLSNLVSPPVNTDTNFAFVSPNQHRYVQRVHSFTGPDYSNNPSDYSHAYQSDAFANRYVDHFIDQSIAQQMVPDILMEVITELDRDNKNRPRKINRAKLNRHYSDLNRRMNEPMDDAHLYSDDWIREVDQHTTRSYSPDVSPRRNISHMRYHDLPVELQGRLLAEVNQELIDYEISNMARELSDQAFEERMAHIRKLTNYRSPRLPVRRETNRFDQKQTQAINDAVDSNLLDALHLNNLISNYLNQSGSKVDVNDLSRLLDGTILDTLVDRYQKVEENRTLDNYATKKFHMNNFMNVPT